MTNRAIADARLRNSRLVGPPLASAQDVVRWFGAVQSQDVLGAMWAVALRMSPGTTVDDVGAAFDDGQIVRTHAMRPTWHFLAPDELRWIQALTGPRVQRGNEAVNRRRLGLTPADFELAHAVFRERLSGGRALTRPELREPLAASGVPFRDANAMAYITMAAELECLICSGPRRGRQFTYQLVDERVPAAPPRDPADALRTLVVRYFRSHGPALPHDMAWWSGLTVGSVREGIALAGAALEGRRIDGNEYWAAAGTFDPAPGPIPDGHVLLLPNYDEYLGSYRDYSPIFDPALPPARTVADVLGAHVVVRDGLVVGGWRRALGRDRVTVTVTLLLPLTSEELGALEAAATAFGRFVGLAVDLRVGSEQRRSASRSGGTGRAGLE